VVKVIPVELIVTFVNISDLDTIVNVGVVLPHNVVFNPVPEKGINPVSPQGPTEFSAPTKRCGTLRQLPSGHLDVGGVVVHTVG
jgi:hypothetical protein